VPGSPMRTSSGARNPAGGVPPGAMAVPDKPASSQPASSGEDGMDLSTFDRRGSSLHILASRRHSAMMAASMRLRTGSAASGSPSVDDDVPAPRSQFLRTRVEDRATMDAIQVAADRSLHRTGSASALRFTGAAAAAPTGGTATALQSPGPAASPDEGAGLDGEPFVPGAVRRRRSSIEKRPDLIARVHSTARIVASPLGSDETAPASGGAAGRSPAPPTVGSYRTLAGKPTVIEDMEGGSSEDVTGAAGADADIWMHQPPVTVSVVTQELRHQSRRHGERLGRTEAAAAALPSYAQNPFTYAGAGRWISKKELGGSAV